MSEEYRVQPLPGQLGLPDGEGHKVKDDVPTVEDVLQDDPAFFTEDETDVIHFLYRQAIRKHMTPDKLWVTTVTALEAVCRAMNDVDARMRNRKGPEGAQSL